MNKLSNNNVARDMAGRDINHFYTNKLSLFEEFKQLSEIVKNKLPKGVYNHYKKKFVPYSSKQLFESLLELAIPSEVAIEIVRMVPFKIDDEIKNDIFSTRNIRRIVYSILKRLDYNKFGESTIQLWGENYIRKYGSSDFELKVILDEERRYVTLDRQFIEQKLLPEIYYKCYNRDINEDLKLLKSKKLVKEITNEILEKVRLLNLYHLRYSTLYKLSYDLAIQPPHHWFTDRVFKENHIEYNITKYEKNYKKIVERDDIQYSSYEFIEHICATILSLYSLFIGIGKLRPLVSLLNYLKLKDTNPDFWDSIELSNIGSELKSITTKTTFYKFKYILERVNYQITDLDSEYVPFLENASFLRCVTNELVDQNRNLKNLKKDVTDNNDLKTKAYFLFNFFENLNIKSENLLRLEFKHHFFSNDLKALLKIGFLFIDNKEKTLNIELDKIHDSNSLLIISNVRISTIYLQEILFNEQIEDDFVFLVTLDEILDIVNFQNRDYNMEKLLSANIV